MLVGRVVVAEDSVGLVRRPGQGGFRDRTGEILFVERRKDLVEVIDRTFRRRDDLAAAGPFAVSGLVADLGRFDV